MLTSRLMRASFRRACVAFAATGALALACTSVGSSPVDVSVGPTILLPRDVLENATSVKLAVYDEANGVSCDAATGQAKGATSTTATVGTSTLGSCPAGSTSKFCGTLTITESTATLAFAATAFDSTGAAIAYGCSSAVVNSATGSVSITMIRNAPAATCGDKTIEPGEQCDPPPAAGATDAVCDSECHSLEETLSTGSSTPEGPAFLLWPAGSGQGGELFAFFTDATAGGTRTSDVALRVMDAELEPLSTPPAAAGAILAPNDATSTLPPVPAPGNQSQPSAAFVLGTYFYVFVDDSFGASAIHMRSFDGTLTGQQAQSAPIVIDGPATGPSPSPDAGTDAAADGGDAGEGNEAGADAGGPGKDGGSVEQSVAPSVGLSGTGSLFIAWQDVSGPSAGQILGRTYTPTGGSLGAITTISATTATTNENVQVAGTETGWVAVWDDSTAIKMRVFSGNGTPNGPEIIVSGASHTGPQDHPSVAVLADGRLAVVWADHGASGGTDIFVQR
jgi:hypothetical protein